MAFGTIQPFSTSSLPQRSFRDPKDADQTLPAAKILPLAHLLELCGQQACARTSTAVHWLREAQHQDELTAWVQPEHGDLFPPDLADAGVDLDSLVVVQVPRARGAHALIAATEMLLRSGCFGLIVVDLSESVPRGAPSKWQGRLQALLRKHQSRVCLLTSSEPHEPSAGPMVGLRLQTTRVRNEDGQYRLHHQILKNKVGLQKNIADSFTRTPAGL